MPEEEVQPSQNMGDEASQSLGPEFPPERPGGEGAAGGQAQDTEGAGSVPSTEGAAEQAGQETEGAASDDKEAQGLQQLIGKWGNEIGETRQTLGQIMERLEALESRLSGEASAQGSQQASAGAQDAQAGQEDPLKDAILHSMQDAVLEGDESALAAFLQLVEERARLAANETLRQAYEQQASLYSERARLAEKFGKDLVDKHFDAAVQRVQRHGGVVEDAFVSVAFDDLVKRTQEQAASAAAKQLSGAGASPTQSGAPTEPQKPASPADLIRQAVASIETGSALSRELAKAHFGNQGGS